MVEQKIESESNKPVETLAEEEDLATANQYLANKQPRKAEQLFRKAIANHPHLWQAYESLAQLLTAENKQKEILNLYRQGIQNNPQNPLYVFALAKVLSEQKKWRFASSRYQQALKLNPNAPWGYLNWAKVLVELKQWEQAQEATLKAIELQPELWDAYHHLGKILQHQHQWQLALEAYQQVIKLNPDFLHSYLRLAEVYCQLKKDELAINCYHHVINQAIDKSPIQDQALKAYEETLKNKSDVTAQQYFQLGSLCRAKGRFPKAIAAFQQAIILDPQWQMPYILIQYTAVGKEKLAELVDFYQQLVSQNPNLPLAWGNLGDALSQQNKITEAIDCYRKSCYQKVIHSYPQLAQLDWNKPKQNQPDFIIVGASKCGTSSLHKYLSYHPQILLSHKKELDFFGKHFSKGIDWYLAHFPSITDSPYLFTGEATPNYLRFPQVAQRIQEKCPNSKLIILLRNPVDRAISWHYHKINTGLTTGTIEDAITQEIKLLENLNETELMAGGYRPIDNIFSSLYYYQLKAWLKYLPLERFLILKSEDFYADTAKVMKQVFTFLEITPQQLKAYPKVNAGVYSTVAPEIKNQLRDYFRPYNQQLEELLNLEFNWD